MKTEPQTENLLVEVIGTLFGLAVIGGVAWAMLYFRGRAGAPYTTMTLIVLGCVATAMLGPKIFRALKAR